MKTGIRVLLLILIASTFSLPGSAAEPLTGYVVMANNDTIICKIKGGRFLNPFYGITIINEAGQEQSFRAKDKKIIAFGFVEYLRRYHYLFVEAGDKYEHGFYQRVVDGKYKLYGRPATVQGDLPTYVLFNSTGQFTKFQACLICPWKKQLRELLKDDTKAVEAVESAKPSNVPQFVMDLNKMNN